MSEENKHINYSAADIEKYLKGELSPSTMHAMEKAALEDPFLADAMDGYAVPAGDRAAGIKDSQPDIDELRKRLSDRVKEKDAAPVIRFSWWKVAAVVFVFLGAGWFYLAVNSNNKVQGIAKSDTQQKEAVPVGAAPPDSDAVANKTTDSISSAATSDLAANDTKKIEKANKQVTDYKKTAAGPPAATASKPAVANADDLQKTPATEKEETKKDLAKNLTANRARKAEGNADQISSAAPPLADKSARAMPEQAPGKTASAVHVNTFNGTVVDQSNRPVANATVQIPNLNIATATNTEGKFSFQAPDTALNVAVNSVGYESQNLRLSNSVAYNQVTLKPASHALNEVVVTGFGSQKKQSMLSKRKDITINILDAEPSIDWNAYTAYLEKNKKLPEEMKDLHGDVVVSFVVDSKNELKNFRIEKSLNEQADAEAIRLIKEGPSWKLLKGKKAKASVIVKF